jgi:hypothetical protein
MLPTQKPGFSGETGFLSVCSSLFMIAYLIASVVLSSSTYFKRQTFQVFRNPEGRALLAAPRKKSGFSVLYFFSWS